MHHWFLYCVDCDQLLPAPIILSASLQAKRDILRRWPNLSGCFSGDVLFWPGDDCRHLEHLVVTYSWPAVHKVHGPPRIRGECRRCRGRYDLRPEEYDLFGNLCYRCADRMAGRQEDEEQGSE